MIDKIFESVESGRFNDMPVLVQQALDAGCAPLDILNNGMIAAMDHVGELFKLEELYVPEMLIAAMAMKAGVDVLGPYLTDGDGSKKGKMVMGTVHGDLHDIGKNLVIMMIESAGFEVVDLGIDVPVQAFLDAVEKDPAVTIVGVSALLTTTMASMRETVAALNKSPDRARFTVMVGGAPITPEFAKDIGADIYTTDAVSAAQAAKKLVG